MHFGSFSSTKMHCSNPLICSLFPLKTRYFRVGPTSLLEITQIQSRSVPLRIKQNSIREILNRDRCKNKKILQLKATRKLIGESVLRALRLDVRSDVCSWPSARKGCNYASVARSDRKGSRLLSGMPQVHTFK